MKTNKKIFSVVVFAISMILLGGCSRDESGIWIQRQIAKKESQKQRLQERSPAQSAPRCFIDRFQDALIRQEVQKMEDSYADGKRGSLEFGGVQFNDLPQATIDLLNQKYLLDTQATGSKSWTAVDAKQKDCKDYACFVNALYANPDNEGLLHYWYFLKTGFSMSAYQGYPWFSKDKQKTATVSAEGYDLEKYLFDKNEWKAFWLATQLLPTSMLHMPSVQGIHRLPHGFVPESWSKTGTCAWAVGYWGGGHILLSDGCMSLYPKNIFDTDAYFYQATTHELAHRLSSWNFATKTAPASAMDEEPAFLALSSWTKESLAQPDGKFQEVWKNGGEEKGWVSGYAETSPAEDFAETVGYYRTQPGRLQSRAPAKYEYVKKKVFAGRGYTNDELKQRYIENVRDGVIENVDQWIEPCLTGREATPLTTKQMPFAKKIEVKLPIDQKVKVCIQKQVVNAILTELAQIRYDEPEGCRVLGGNGVEATVMTSALAQLNPDLNEYFKTYEKLTDLIKGVGDFRKALIQEFDGRAWILLCASEPDQAACYSAKASAEFDRLFQKYKVLLSTSVGDIAEIERKRFLSSNAYNEVYEEVVQFYESFFAKFNDEIRSRTDQIWQACLAVPSRVNTDVLLEPYSAGGQYVAPAVIQCLNEKIPEEMTAIRSAAGEAQDVSIFSPEAKAWVNQRILFPRFKSLLDAKITDTAKVEVAQLESLKQPSLESTYQNLIQDRSWMKNPSYSYLECKAAAVPLIQQGLKVDRYRFVVIEPIIEELSNQVCEKVRLWFVEEASRPTPAPEQPSTAAFGQELDPVWKRLQPLVVAEAATRFERCRGRVYFTQRLKRFCLFNEWTVDDQDQYRKTAWNWTKERAIRKWLADEEVKTFLKPKGQSEMRWFEAAKARAEDERQEFVDAILDRFYGGSAESNEN